MVVGNAPESIQYPWTAPCMGWEGGKRRLSYLWMFLVALTKFRFVLDEDSYLVPELDGVRIFSRNTHEFLHEVPGEAPTSIQCEQGRCPWPQTPILSYANGPEHKLGVRGRTENYHASFLLKHSPLVASEEIFKIASMAPGALLLEAQKEYEVISEQLVRFPRCPLPFSFPD